MLVDMTAAHNISRAITSRLRGQCRLTPGGTVVTRGASKVDDCGACADACDTRDEWSPLQGGIDVKPGVNGEFKLRWVCPSCRGYVHQGSTLGHLFQSAAEIGLDPLCARCRV